MDKPKLKQDYEQYKKHYKILQNEVFHLISALEQEHHDIIHIESINQRPDKDIKQFESIISNIQHCPVKKLHRSAMVKKM